MPKLTLLVGCLGLPSKEICDPGGTWSIATSPEVTRSESDIWSGHPLEVFLTCITCGDKGADPDVPGGII